MLSNRSAAPKLRDPDRKADPSDLSDAEWEIINPLLPAAKGCGHPRTVNKSEILNAIFYVHRSGCQWEILPHDLPPHGTVDKYFHKWERKGIGKQIHHLLRHKLRKQMGRAEKSTVAIADSQSVKTTEKKGSLRLRAAANSLRVANARS